ncbi:MAG TPA: four-carbon acid sugar kinase family protein [Thermomicrobiales bacterium]|nr:four-carbon acid sugar kinase family protein [Thermomicrobiales bacterium]
MTLLAVIADDLTGAGDAGGAFATAGLRTVILFGNERSEDADVIVRSTDSRGLDTTDAAEVNRRAVRGLRCPPPRQPPRWVYKKIDSALRGHPCEELLAVMRELGERRALVAPALPAQGRTTAGSRQLVDGIPLDQTPFGVPASGADLISVFGCERQVAIQPITLATVRHGTGHVAHAIEGLEEGILVADAETDRDLMTIAGAALDNGIRVMAGSAGLARQLATTLPAPVSARRAATPDCRTGPILVVAGSRHPSAAAQVAALVEAGVPLVHPSQEMLDGTAPVDTTVAALAPHLFESRFVALTTTGLAASPKGPEFVVRQLAAIVAALAERHLVGGLVLTGGDVAAGVLARLKATEIMLGGEVQAAIPWGILRSRLLPEVPIVTKAGSFGDRGTILRCLKHLER